MGWGSAILGGIGAAANLAGTIISGNKADDAVSHMNKMSRKLNKLWDPAKLAADEQQRRDLYIRDTNQSMERAGSIMQAKLLDAGMGASTLAVQRQREFADLNRDALQEAEVKARDDALSYMTRYVQGRGGPMETAMHGYSKTAEIYGNQASSSAQGFGASLDNLLKQSEMTAWLDSLFGRNEDDE